MTTTNGRKPRPPRRRPHSLRPYRDSALVYGAFAVIVVVIAAATGGEVLWAALAATGAFVLGLAWTWRAIRLHEERRRR